jgi:hypothetical protein
MHALRHLPFLARLVLAWFVLATGVAVASPLVNPQSVQLICSGSGVVKLVAVGDEGDQALAGHGMECPLCAPAAVPPPPVHHTQVVVQPLAYAMGTIAAAHIAARTAAPLPPRGPPVIP